MPRWNRYGRVGLCCALAFSIAGCYSYPYSPYAPHGPGMAPGAPVYQQPMQPGPAFPSGGGTYAPPGTSFVQPSGPAAYGGYPADSTNLPTPVPDANDPFESIPPSSGSGSNNLVPNPQDMDNTTDPFGEPISSNSESEGETVSNPFKRAIVGTSNNRSIARTTL